MCVFVDCLLLFFFLNFSLIYFCLKHIKAMIVLHIFIFFWKRVDNVLVFHFSIVFII